MWRGASCGIVKRTRRIIANHLRPCSTISEAHHPHSTSKRNIPIQLISELHKDLFIRNYHTVTNSHARSSANQIHWLAFSKLNAKSYIFYRQRSRDFISGGACRIIQAATDKSSWEEEEYSRAECASNYITSKQLSHGPSASQAGLCRVIIS